MPSVGQVYTPGVPMPGGPSSPVGKAAGSTAAMVLGIIGLVLCPILILSILAIIFGLRARKKINASGGQLGGKGQATAGLVTGIIGLLLGAGVIGLSIANRDSVSVSMATAGDCVRVPSGDELVSSFKRQDCDKVHEGEVVGVGELQQAGQEPFPGEEEIQRLVDAACARSFEDYVGTPPGTDELILLYILPSRESWKSGDGTYVCIASNEARALTGSVEG